MKKFNTAIILILSAVMLIFSIGSSIASTDIASNYLKTLCSQKDTQLCEGYLWGVLDIQQSDPAKNKNLCICGRDTLCGMSAVDTKKLPTAFMQWTEKNYVESATYEVAVKFVDTAFSCSRENPNDFLYKY